MATFQERKLLRELAKKEHAKAELAKRVEMEAQFQRWLEWASIKTLCDWCNTEKPRRDFLHLERDEAGLKPHNDEGETNCCWDCADDYLDGREDCEYDTGSWEE